MKRLCIRCAVIAGLLASAGCTNAYSGAPRDSNPDCSAAAFRQFDFWLGTWVIEQRILAADGTWLAFPASTHVSASPDGCVLTEHWSGEVQFFWENMAVPQKIWGYSVRRFDPLTQRWAIYWMDSRNPLFDTPHVGDFNGGRGEFLRDTTTPAGSRRSRIAFDKRTDGTVFWQLAVSADGGVTYSPLWTMHMRRADG